MRRDFYTGVTGLCGAVFFAVITAATVRQVPNALEPGPRMMPYIACTIIAVCSLALIITSLKNRGQEEKPYFPIGGVKKITVAYLLLLGYGIALHTTGFLISTPFAMLAFIYMLKGEGKVKPVVGIAISLAVTAVLYLMFVKGFSIKLPSGILWKGGM